MSDDDGLSRLVSRFENLELDLDGQKQTLLEYRNGDSHAESLKSSLDYIDRNLQTYKSQGNKNNRYNQTVLRSYLISYKINLNNYGHNNDIQEILTLARQNYKRSPSSGTRADLESALVHHFIQGAKTKLDGFDEFAKKYALIFSEGLLFSLALERVEGFKPYVLKHQLYPEFESLLEFSVTNFPDTPSIVDWKILNQLSNPQAKTIAQQYRDNKMIAQQYLLAYKKTINQEYINYIKTIEQEMLGNIEAAKRLNQTAIDDGLEVPKLYL